MTAQISPAPSSADFVAIIMACRRCVSTGGYTDCTTAQGPMIRGKRILLSPSEKVLTSGTIRSDPIFFEIRVARSTEAGPAITEIGDKFLQGIFQDTDIYSY